jgi:hypothetical protein
MSIDHRKNIVFFHICHQILLVYINRVSSYRRYYLLSHNQLKSCSTAGIALTVNHSTEFYRVWICCIKSRFQMKPRARLERRLAQLFERFGKKKVKVIKGGLTLWRDRIEQWQVFFKVKYQEWLGMHQPHTCPQKVLIWTNMYKFINMKLHVFQARFDWAWSWAFKSTLEKSRHILRIDDWDFNKSHKTITST